MNNNVIAENESSELEEDTNTADNTADIKSYKICHCGFTEDNHEFRHRFEESATINIHDEKIVEFDCNEFETLEKTSQNCKYPQCNASKSLHGSIITKHEFISDDPEYYRNIYIELPGYIKCSSCNNPIHNHMYRHHISIKKKANNYKNTDIVRFTHDNREISMLF